MSFFGWLDHRAENDVPRLPDREFGPTQDDLNAGVPESALNPIDSDRDGNPDAITGICIAIEYIDASAQVSNRRVIVERVYQGDESVYCSGFCLLRKEQRTFRVDRIKSLRLPPKWLERRNPIEFFELYLPKTAMGFVDARTNDTYERYARLYDVRKAANNGLRVLAFVARADGAIADPERAVVKSYVRDASRLIGEPLPEADCAEIASDIEKLFPTKRQVANSLNAIRLYHEQCEIFLNSVTRLVRADGDVSAREQSAFQLLVEILRKSSSRAV